MLYTNRVSSSIYTRVLFHCYTCASVGFDEKKKRTPSVLYGPTVGTRNYRFRVHYHCTHRDIYMKKKNPNHYINTHTINTRIVLLYWLGVRRDDDAGSRDRIIVMYTTKFGGRPSRMGYHACR